MQKDTHVTDSLFGMFADEYAGQEYQDLLDEALLESYIIDEADDDSETDIYPE